MSRAYIYKGETATLRFVALSSGRPMAITDDITIEMELRTTAMGRVLTKNSAEGGFDLAKADEGIIFCTLSSEDTKRLTPGRATIGVTIKRGENAYMGATSEIDVLRPAAVPSPKNNRLIPMDVVISDSAVEVVLDFVGSADLELKTINGLSLKGEGNINTHVHSVTSEAELSKLDAYNGDIAVLSYPAIIKSAYAGALQASLTRDNKDRVTPVELEIESINLGILYAYYRYKASISISDGDNELIRFGTNWDHYIADGGENNFAKVTLEEANERANSLLQRYKGKKLKVILSHMRTLDNTLPVKIDYIERQASQFYQLKDNEWTLLQMPYVFTDRGQLLGTNAVDGSMAILSTGQRAIPYYRQQGFWESEEAVLGVYGYLQIDADGTISQDPYNFPAHFIDKSYPKEIKVANGIMVSLHNVDQQFGENDNMLYDQVYYEKSPVIDSVNTIVGSYQIALKVTPDSVSCIGDGFYDTLMRIQGRDFINFPDLIYDFEYGWQMPVFIPRPPEGVNLDIWPNMVRVTLIEEGETLFENLLFYLTEGSSDGGYYMNLPDYRYTGSCTMRLKFDAYNSDFCFELYEFSLEENPQFAPMPDAAFTFPIYDEEGVLTSSGEDPFSIGLLRPFRLLGNITLTDTYFIRNGYSWEAMAYYEALSELYIEAEVVGGNDGIFVIKVNGTQLEQFYIPWQFEGEYCLSINRIKLAPGIGISGERAFSAIGQPANGVLISPVQPLLDNECIFDLVIESSGATMSGRITIYGR